MVSLVDLKAQYAGIKGDVDAALQRVLDATAFILGEEVRSFEADFARYCGVGYAVGVASGTAALHLALLACGVGAGDEVITSPHTFIATAEAISHTGAQPVFADIEALTYNLDPDRVEAAISSRTKAIVPVHLYGRPANMEGLLDIAQRKQLRVVEDAAQAHGARYRGRRVGTLGDAGCFSFYPGKNLGAYGDGGMVVTEREDLAVQVRMLRDHGRRDKYVHQSVGYGERLDALQAAVLAVKLKHLDAWNARRRCAAGKYKQLLVKVPVVLPADPGDAELADHLFVIRVRDRDRVLERLNRAGIGAGVHYPIPLHRQPAYQHLGYAQGSFPEAERAAAEILSLPLYPEITEDQIVEVVTILTASL